MQIGDVALLYRTAQFAFVVGEFYPVLLDDIARTAHRCCAVVSVFGYFVTCTGNYETGAGRYVERIFPVAARTDYIYRCG